ncbi:MAG: molybdopterin-dependent oxidoreductase [Firmicutes bacterium]|nr:molybdopterin-dependent oxidoreductase [Bacillota bacterium]
MEHNTGNTDSTGNTAAGGRWVTAACWGDCGGRCLNRVYVAGEVPIRQKTDDTHSDSPDFPQQRACARGRAYRQAVFGSNRVRHPMKRKHWAPGGRKDLRGRDEWERISWDEALDVVSGEIERVKTAYGNASILAWGAEIGRMLSLYGGYLTSWGSTSWGTWLNTGPAIGLDRGSGCMYINDRFDLRRSEVVVVWGANPALSSGGNPTYNYLQAARAGARFIFIDPVYTDSVRVLGGDWIPCRPATDHALALGIAHTLLTEDDPSSDPLMDWDFLYRCTVGFDREHMPGGEDPRSNFKDYLLGTRDGQPKTPDWASRICGVEPETIRRLAREIGCRKRVALLTGWAPARVNSADSWPQVFMALGCMTGHFGLPGRMTGVSAYAAAGNGGPALVRAGDPGVPDIANPLASLAVNNNEVWDAVLTGRYTLGDGVEGEAGIRLIYHAGAAKLNQLTGLVKGIDAHRRVEFVVTQDPFFSTQARYSDIVLPVTTPWERFGLVKTGNREIIVFASQVVEPLFESRDDSWIAVEIGRRLGLDPGAIDPVPLKQQVFNQVAGAVVARADGSGFEPLVDISATDIEEIGVEGRPQRGRIPFREFKERGIYQVPRAACDSLGHIAFERFRADPARYPLDTRSGRLEIHCRVIAEFVRSCGWDRISPLPEYRRPVEGYEDASEGGAGYPLQMITPHARGRTNSSLAGVPWLTEAFPQELLMSSADASSRGITDGDTVVVSSKHGRIICPVRVTARVMPGVVSLPEGAWADMDENECVDRGASANVLVGAIPTGQGHSGWNSCNVQVERYRGSGRPPADGGRRVRRDGSQGASQGGPIQFDSSLCIGCKACQIACKDRNNLGVGEFIRRVDTFEGGEYPRPEVYHLSLSCDHCESPACAGACPSGAVSRRADGAVLIDEALCTGCGACADACPNGGVQVLGGRGKAAKCDLCSDLLAAGEQPACVAACVMRALTFKPVSRPAAGTPSRLHV